MAEKGSWVGETIGIVGHPALMSLTLTKGELIEFVDIAGLVKGASKGEGLGNKFLSHIREVDAIIHVLRCFEDQDITHVHGKIDPIHDAEIVETELIIADLESIDKRIASNEKKLKSGDKKIAETIELLKASKAVLEQGNPVRTLIDKYSKKDLSSLQLITSKPVLYVCNVLESEAASGNDFTSAFKNVYGIEWKDAVKTLAKVLYLEYIKFGPAPK